MRLFVCCQSWQNTTLSWLEYKNKEPLSELGNKGEDHSIRLRATGLYVVNTNLSNSSSPWCREQQGKKRIIDISEIVQILRTMKLQQCKGSYYNAKKFCEIFRNSRMVRNSNLPEKRG
ncbi:MAG: hypothetical protein JO327_00835 [Nitrososphaeraceae archaeon]|nr:hypothetical protein [Nitrososphaeraceae archaeon]MBV9666651.1 hypothetical protein [Nitrososphaeraceae archaeon]